MRKTTMNLILGIVIGILISGLSNTITGIKSPVSPKPPIASTIKKQEEISVTSNPFVDAKIAPGLQIVKVPPPLDLNGRHPYQCYINGKPVKLPVDMIEEIICEHGDPTENDPNFNVHNFTGNLKLVGVPFGE